MLNRGQILLSVFRHTGKKGHTHMESDLLKTSYKCYMLSDFYFMIGRNKLEEIEEIPNYELDDTIR